MSDAYQGVAFNTKFVLLNGVDTNNVIGCIQLETVPILASYTWYTLVFCIFGIAMLIGATFLLTAYLNPWTGTKNVYLWCSNFGHDSSVVRLITPGFFDFFKYLQFAVFLTCLSLEYPAFLPPIISTISWSCLFFPSTLLASNKGDLTDGIYTSNSSYGLEAFSQVNQISQNYDIWSSFMIYLLIITAGVVAFCEVVAVIAWTWRKCRHDASNVWSRNFSFVIGLATRIFFNLFAFPLLVFCFFQFFITSRGSPAYLTALAALVLTSWILLAIWISYRLVSTRPRQTLFDDLTTMLRYGTFYNTYNEQGSIFFLVDFAVLLLRSVVVGAVQQSGLAQIILLAIIELSNFFCLIIIKPFDKDTSMNLISCLTSILRLILVFLSLPFLESLDIELVPRQWLGYVILVIHALVILLFLMHACQVTIEVISRYNGAGVDGKTGAIYSLKQLSRRRKKTDMLESKEDPSSLDTMRHNSLDGRVLPMTEESKLPPVANIHDEISTTPTTLARGLTQKSFAKDSTFDDVYISSPTSEISSFGGSAPLSAPLSANPMRSNSGTFYRKPRRRASSHEWGNATSYLYREGHPSAGDTAANGAEIDGIRAEIVSPPPPGVNYAIREADIYYTKHGQYAPKKKRHRNKRETKDSEDGEGTYGDSNFGSIDSDTYATPSRLSDYNETKGVLSKQHTRNPNSLVGLLEIDAPELSTEAPKSHVEESKEETFSRLTGWLKGKKQALFSKGHTEPSIEPKGFEVIRRGPIRPYRKSESSDSDSSTENEDSEPPRAVSSTPEKNLSRKMSVVNPTEAGPSADIARTPSSGDGTSSSKPLFIFPATSTSLSSKTLSPGRTTPTLRLLTSSEALLPTPVASQLLVQRPAAAELDAEDPTQLYPKNNPDK